MRRPAVIIALLVAIILLAFVGRIVVQERRFTVNRQVGAACAQRLRPMLASDDRFRDVSVEGYNVHGGFVSAADYFYVSGFVTSKTDLVDLERLVRSVQPPGRLSLLVTVDARRMQRTEP
jgi:hypothetical protein